jgi:hypothetical protein
MASAKALAGVDTAAVDPRAVLKAIAADVSAPASARAAAAKALLADAVDREIRAASAAAWEANDKRIIDELGLQLCPAV